MTFQNSWGHNNDVKLKQGQKKKIVPKTRPLEKKSTLWRYWLSGKKKTMYYDTPYEYIIITVINHKWCECERQQRLHAAISRYSQQHMFVVVVNHARYSCCSTSQHDHVYFISYNFKNCSRSLNMLYSCILLWNNLVI